MTSEDLLTKLKSDSNERTKKTLDSIYEVCKKQLQKGESDFSYTTISKIGENLKIPKPQSIRNKSGEKYRILIDYFKTQTGAQNRKKVTKEFDWVKKISDPSSRILINQLIFENKNLKKQIDEQIPPNTLITIKDKSTPIDTEFELTPLEKRAIEYLLSNSFRRKLSLTENDFGAYIDSNNNTIFPAGTSHALKKALKQ